MKTLQSRKLTTTALIGLSAAALTLTACGAQSGTDGDPTSTSDASSTCGVVPDLGANDPNNLLDEALLPNFNGYPIEVQASAWADWKPDHEGPYTAALVSPPPTDSYIAGIYDSLRAELDAAGVEIIADYAVAENSDVPGQLQQFNEAVAADPDIIFFTALAPAPAVEALEAAGAAGIPVVGVESSIESEYAVSVARNSVLQAMEAGSVVVEAMGGSGDVLKVLGIPGISVDTLAWVGYDAVLAECPDIRVAGEITGNFVPATAQAETLKFLATNPAGVGGVLQAGAMGYSVLQAFQESGIDPAPIADTGSVMGFINWVAENPDYAYQGSASPAEYMGKINAEVGLRILAGEGPKVNLLVGQIEMIDAEQAVDLADPDAEPRDLVIGEPETVTFPEGELDLYFNNPGLAK